MPSSDTYFQKGNRNTHRRGRPSKLDDPEMVKAIAAAFVAGETRESMCEMFGVKDVDTITRWRRDARVKRHAFKLIEDRVLEVTRKVDSKIAYMLQNDDLTIQELLAIRKEFLGGALRAQTENADSDTLVEGQNWIDANPEDAERLMDMLRGNKLPQPLADRDEE